MSLPQMNAPSDGRVLLLTGAAGGIGRAVMRRSLHDGFRVFAVDRLDPTPAPPPTIASDGFAPT
ncbi:MAG: hypothetical protein ABI565_05065 [Vicinamibacteria bacterium]